MDNTTNDDLKILIETLIKELRENTETNNKLVAMLEENNAMTRNIHDYVGVELSATQQWKNFGYNVLANIAASTVNTPTIVDFSGNNRK